MLAKASVVSFPISSFVASLSVLVAISSVEVRDSLGIVVSSVVSVGFRGDVLEIPEVEAVGSVVSFFMVVAITSLVVRGFVGNVSEVSDVTSEDSDVKAVGSVVC